MNQELTGMKRQDQTVSTSKLVKGTRFEIMAVILLFALFLLVNLLTASRSPTVWIDEVMYTDPAANLYFGNGFTSTAWHAQTSDEFWAGNAPLHQIVLYPWISMFGFSPTAVRSLNYVFMVASGIMLWFAVVRLRLVNTPWARMALVTLLLSGYGITFSYRSGRPDGVAILLFLAGVLAYSSKSKWVRYLLMVGVSTLFPIVQLQLAAYSFFLGVVLVLFLKTPFLREFLCILIGLAGGFTCLYFLYSVNGVWEGFLRSISGHSFVGLSVAEKLLGSFTEFGTSGFRDYSFLLLLILSVTVAAYQIVTKSFRCYSLLFFGIIVSAAVPFGMMVTGKFPLFYSWMVFIPVSVCLLAAVEKFDIRPGSWKGMVLAAFLFSSSLVGLPVRLAVTILQWQERDYAPVEALVARNIKESDRVYSDFGAYYAVKRKAAATFLPTYLRVMLPNEKKSISVLVINPDSFHSISSLLGGEWKAGESFTQELSPMKRFGAEKYAFQIFRKT